MYFIFIFEYIRLTYILVNKLFIYIYMRQMLKNLKSQVNSQHNTMNNNLLMLCYLILLYI